MVVIAFILDFAVENLGLFGLPNEITVFVGLILGEISKYVNARNIKKIKNN